MQKELPIKPEFSTTPIPAIAEIYQYQGENSSSSISTTVENQIATPDKPEIKSIQTPENNQNNICNSYQQIVQIAMNSSIFSHVLTCISTFCDFAKCSELKIQIYHSILCPQINCSICLSIYFMIIEICNVQPSILMQLSLFQQINPILIKYNVKPNLFMSSSFNLASPPIVPVSTVNENNLSGKEFRGQWLRCKFCNKQRKIPRNVSKFIANTFECGMNIWESQFRYCDAEEEHFTNACIVNIKSDYSNYLNERDSFIEYIKKICQESKSGLVFRIPTLGKKDLDLYKLFRIVTAYGGAHTVILNEGTWAKIYSGLENYSSTETSSSFRLKKIYTKYLLAVESIFFKCELGGESRA